MNEKTKYLTPQEYAELMRIHSNTLYRLLNEGKIKGAIRVGDSWRIPEPNHKSEE